MDTKKYDMENADIAWCPGCGNYNILKILKQALAELEIDQKKLVLVSGIGQAAKAPHYLRANVFNGLHGRALPAAVAIKASNPELEVIVESGDGDIYGEGGNHLIHNIRRNPDIVCIVHDNMVYGLTKGQASPTSLNGFKTPVQVDGVFEKPFNPMALAIAMDASFAARAFAGDTDGTKEIIKKAITHKGFALVDVFQPCVTFNKVNTYQWFKDNTYQLESSYDPRDRANAFKRSIETEKLPLGILYINEGNSIFEETLPVYKNNKLSVIKRETDISGKLNSLFNTMAHYTMR